MLLLLPLVGGPPNTSVVGALTKISAVQPIEPINDEFGDDLFFHIKCPYIGRWNIDDDDNDDDDDEDEEDVEIEEDDNAMVVASSKIILYKGVSIWIP